MASKSSTRRKKVTIPDTPHKGWQESAENWELWRRYKNEDDMAARDELFGMYLSQCSRILSRYVSYVDQREANYEDSMQEAGILMLGIMGEFNPMKAESFKVYIISYGTRRAVDIARTNSTVPRRVREATAIYNHAREQLELIEGFQRSMAPVDIQYVLDYVVEQEMWPKWLGQPTVEKIQTAVEVRDRGLASYSLDAPMGDDEDGGSRESVAVRVEGHEDSVVNDIMRENLSEVLNFVLRDLSDYDRDILEAAVTFPLENGEVGGVEGVRCHMQALSESLGYGDEEVSRGRAVKALGSAQSQARSLFIKHQDDILVHGSGDELLEIISRYLNSVEEADIEAPKTYKKAEQLVVPLP